MKQWSNLSLSIVMGGLATSIAFAQSPITPEVLFYDGFESGDLSNWPFSNGAGPQEPLVAALPLAQATAMSSSEEPRPRSF